MHGGIGGAEPTSEETCSIMVVKVIVRLFALVGVLVVLSSPKMLPVAVVLSVLAVEVRLTVAGINMSMV